MALSPLMAWRLSDLLEQVKNAVSTLTRERPPVSGDGVPGSPGPASAVDVTGLSEYLPLKEFVNAYSSDSPPAVLAFGDSVFLRVADDDRSMRSLGGLLADYYGTAMVIISGSGYHSGVFERFATVLAALPARPRIAILPVNLRSFSPTWDLNPRYQFESEIELLASFDPSAPNYRFECPGARCQSGDNLVLLSSESHGPMTLKEFLEIVGARPDVDAPEWNARLRTIFHYHYAYRLSFLHRRLLSLTNAIRVLNSLGVAVYSYFTPINYEAGQDYCGESFLSIVTGNISRIREAVLSGTPPFRLRGSRLALRLDDFACEFSRSVFFTPHNATEHLRLDGRDFLFRSIVAAARPVLEEEHFEQ